MRRLAVLVVMVLVLSACWEQRGFDAGNSRSSPLPTPVTVGNVGSLTHRITAGAVVGHAVRRRGVGRSALRRR